MSPFNLADLFSPRIWSSLDILVDSQLTDASQVNDFGTISVSSASSSCVWLLHTKVVNKHSLDTKYYILYLILRRFDLFSSWGMSNWFIYVPYGTNTRNPPRLSSHATQLKREILAGALFTSWTIWIPIRTTAPYPSPSRLSQGDVDMDNVLIIAPTWQFTRSW